MILVMGATGYIGSSLIPKLLNEQHTVRCLARHPEDLEENVWYEKSKNNIELVFGNVFKPQTLLDSFQGIDTLYYLIHSIDKNNFEEKDKEAALNVAKLAKETGVKHIIYMSALGDSKQHISKHLKSRQDTAKYLASTGVAVTELRAAIVVGSGSTSFELIRYLTERLPVIPMPKWADTKVQPIAIEDVIDYLVAAQKAVPKAHKIIEIGGADVLSYKDLMLQYASARSLKRPTIPLPIFPTRLASYFANILTPIPMVTANTLLEGLQSEAIVQKPESASALGIKPVSYQVAVQKALDRRNEASVDLLWHDSLHSIDQDIEADSLQDQEGLLFDNRSIDIEASPEKVYTVLKGLGGEYGWFGYDWLWYLRAYLDTLFGGVGMRRRKPPLRDLRVGDTIDFWRVQSLEKNKFIQLSAEMKLPGRGWLRFDLEALDNGGTKLLQTAFYEPKGLFGYLYWWAVYPLHLLVFPALSRSIAKQATSVV